MEARDAAWAHLFDVVRKSPQTKNEHVHWKQRLENATQQVAAEERADAERENARLREELRKAKRAADLLAADHRAVERVQRRLDAWEQKLPENVRRDTVIEVLRDDLGAAA